MKITKDFIQKVKKHIESYWHDQSWWDFEVREEVEAVSYALQVLSGSRPTWQDIKKEAEEYLAITQ